MKIYLNGNEITAEEIPRGSVWICQPRGVTVGEKLRNISQQLHEVFSRHGVTVIAAPCDFDFKLIKLNESDD